MPWRRLRWISSRWPLERQAVDLDHVVEHAGEHADHLAVLVPVEAGLVGERLTHEAGEVDRAEQAGAVRRQRLFAAGVGGADVFAEPVVVHLVDAVDQDEARLGVVVGGGHDHVPQVARLHVAVDLAGHQAVLARDVVLVRGPLAPHDLLRVVQVDLVLFLVVYREDERPVGIGVHRLHEAVGDQKAQVELAQAPVLALGADELAHVRVGDVEGAHLRAAPTAGAGDGEAHLVVDIHERQRPGGVGAGAGDVGAVRSQRGELVADAATRLQRQPRLVDLVQNVVHGVADGARDRAVDGGGGGLVGLGAGVGGDAPGRDRAVAQRPQETLVPRVADLRRFHVGKRTRHALPGVVHGNVEDRAVLRLEAVFLVPDVLRRRLDRYLGKRLVL